MAPRPKTPPPDELLALRIENQRRRAGLSRPQLADALGVTPGAIGHWEKPRYRPSAAHLQALARVLRVPYGELLGENLSGGEREAQLILLRIARGLDDAGLAELCELLGRFACGQVLIAHLRSYRPKSD